MSRVWTDLEVPSISWFWLWFWPQPLHQRRLWKFRTVLYSVSYYPAKVSGFLMDKNYSVRWLFNSVLLPHEITTDSQVYWTFEYPRYLDFAEATIARTSKMLPRYDLILQRSDCPFVRSLNSGSKRSCLRWSWLLRSYSWHWQVSNLYHQNYGIMACLKYEENILLAQERSSASNMEV